MKSKYGFQELAIKNVIIENEYVMECQPYEYFFFRIPEERYHQLKGVILTIEVRSKQATIVLNEFFPNVPRHLTEDGAQHFDISECDAGENILAFKGDIRIVKIELIDRESTRPEEDTSKSCTDSVKQAMLFLLDSQIQAPERSQFKGSCYAIYDYTNQCHRMSAWLWSDAPLVSAALKLAKANTYPELTQKLEKFAKDIGEVFLKTQITDKSDEIYGALVSRYRYYGHKDYSFNKLLGLNDTSYSVKWALLPLYEYTKEEKYLKAARIALDWVEKSVYALDFAPSHYYYENKVWESQAFVDTGFCAEGFEQYMSIVGDRDYSKTMTFIMQRFMKQFKLNTGFYGQNYLPGRGVDDRLFTRGHAWVLEGFLAVYRATKERYYLEEAKDLCYRLIEQQQPGGEWTYLLGYGIPDMRIMEGSGICEKATAILAYLFLEFHRLEEDMKIYESARKALAWCEDHMNQKPGSGYGGIMAASLSSGITGLPFLNVATGYANAYYILANNED